MFASYSVHCTAKLAQLEIETEGEKFRDIKKFDFFPVESYKTEIKI